MHACVQAYAYVRDFVWNGCAGVRDGMSDWQRWSWCFYHSVLQLLGTSEGLVRPEREAEMWCYTFAISLGTVLNAVFLGSLTAVFAEAGAAKRQCVDAHALLKVMSVKSKVVVKVETQLQAYINAEVDVGVDADAGVGVKRSNAFTHALMRTCTNAQTHTCTHARMHAYTHAHMHTCTGVGVNVGY